MKVSTEKVVAAALLVSAGVSQAATVSGIIATDTIWSDISSPYTVDGVVQVAPGVTLSIQPGVTISGGSIEVYGTLQAAGSAETRVVFDGVAIKPGANAVSMSQPFLIDIGYSEINGGSLYAPTGYAIYGSLNLRDSEVRNLQSYMYLWYPTSDVAIERNLLSGVRIDAGTSDSVLVSITNNLFDGGAINNWASYDTSQTVVQFNSLLETLVSLPAGYSDAAMLATYNWWGTTDPTAIGARIFDRNDSLASAGFIQFDPFLTAPDSGTPSPVPIPAAGWLLLTAVLGLVGRRVGQSGKRLSRR